MNIPSSTEVKAPLGGCLMSNKGILTALGILAIGITILLLFGIDIGGGSDNLGTRGTGDYQGALSCAGTECHADLYAGWNATRHARAWEDLQRTGMAQDYCENCHTTGAGDLAHGGFNNITNEPSWLVNVQCEACHGPDPMNATGGPPTRINYSAELCGSCHHTGHHPYYDEWRNSSHSRSLTPANGTVATDEKCQGCHVAQVIVEETFKGGVISRPIQNPQPITCSVCHNPHSNANEYQLRKPRSELCATCHNPAGALPGEPINHPQSSMREGKSAIPWEEVPRAKHMASVLCADCHMYSYPYNASKIPPRVTGHEFLPKPEACASCHNGTVVFKLTVEEASAQITILKDYTHELLYKTGPNVTAAFRALMEAPDYGFNESVISVAKEKYDKANYSLNFVEADGSEGVHNPRYTASLLNYSNLQANEVKEMLRTGWVKGRLLDQNGNSVKGGEIQANGRTLGVTDHEGIFLFAYAPGTHSFDIVRDDRVVGTISNVLVIAGDTTDVGEIRVGADNTLIYFAIGLVILLSIALFLFLRGKRKKV